jgi:SAM-dependent methyltransferase
MAVLGTEDTGVHGVGKNHPCDGTSTRLRGAALKPGDFYEGHQQRYPSIGNSHRLAKVAGLARKYAPGARRVLDIGCGDGTFAAEIKQAVGDGEVYGTDISGVDVALARKRGVDAVVADVDNGHLPFEAATFDLVYAGEIIEHLYDPDHLLDEIGRLLTPGGVAILDTPNLASLVNRLSLLLGFQPFLTDVSLRHNVGKLCSMSPGGSGHIRMFTRRALQQLLRLHSFQILEVVGARALESAYSSYPFYLRMIDGVLGRFPTIAPVLIVVVRRLRGEGAR